MVRKLAKNVVTKKWEIVKICLNVIEENCSIVKEMSIKERVKENVTWNVDDVRNVNLLKTRNVRYLSMRSGNMNLKKKVNNLEQFWERTGLNKVKETWRTEVEREVELKECEASELIKMTKLAKSKKKKLSLFRECKERLWNLIQTWNETPSVEEERIFEMLKERVKNGRMKLALKNLVKESELNNEAAPDDKVLKTMVVERRKCFEYDQGDHTHRNMKLLLKEDSSKASTSRIGIMSDKVNMKTNLKKTATTDNVGTDQARPIPTKTTGRLQSWQFNSEKALTIVDTTTKVSGKMRTNQITKPQLVYCCVETENQIDQNSTSQVNQ